MHFRDLRRSDIYSESGFGHPRSALQSRSGSKANILQCRTTNSVNFPSFVEIQGLSLVEIQHKFAIYCANNVRHLTDRRTDEKDKSTKCLREHEQRANFIIFDSVSVGCKLAISTAPVLLKPLPVQEVYHAGNV